MNQKIDVYGLSEQQHKQLREIALTKYGKASTSLLAKNLLLELLENSEEASDRQFKHPEDKTKNRLEIRLPQQDKKYLSELAEKQNMSSNIVALSILRAYIEKHPKFDNAEIKTLSQSNAQLLRIGRNLNQIARQLNTGESVSLTSEKIAALQQFIDNHTSRVIDVLAANKRRYS